MGCSSSQEVNENYSQDTSGVISVRGEISQQTKYHSIRSCRFGREGFERFSLSPNFAARTYTEKEKGFSIVLSVYDKDPNKNDFIGTTTVPLSSFKLEESVDKWIDLFPSQHGDSKNSAKTAGKIRIQISVSSVQSVERRFWEHMVKTYDSNGNGKISKMELTYIIHALGGFVDDQQLTNLVQALDSDGSQDLDVNELTNLMKQPSKFGLRIAHCPFCKKELPKSDIGTIVHLGACMEGEDFSELITSQFLTETQASQGSITNGLNRISYGKYEVGSQSGNILVFDRSKGVLIEEKIAPVIRLSLRYTYQMSSVAETERVKKLLVKVTQKQAEKFNSPESTKEIPVFIKFHDLNVDEILEPISSFKNFNEFFFRKVKKSSRPIDSADDPAILVSPADSRVVVFPTISEATTLWIKGKTFTLQSLLNDPALASEFEGGAISIFRLAPQDYHRFHFPVDGIVGETTKIPGAYFTVNPMAVRSPISVYDQNIRAITPIETKEFGKVLFISVGATCVASVNFTSTSGSTVKKGDEHGYFAFGGSTVICIFQKDRVQFDEDLVERSSKMSETLLKMGNHVGKATAK